MLLSSNTKVWLALGSTDMRKSINSLSILVANTLQQDIYSGHLFVFCNKSRTTIKILYWDRNGFCLWHKRLEKAKFIWPNSASMVLELNYNQLSWLLDGLDFSKLKGHKELKYTHIF